MKDLLSLKDVNKEFVLSVIEKAIDMKQNPDNYRTALKDKTLLMIFEKPSLRTRVSFEVGMTQMGGHAIYYDVSTSPLGRKETIEDTAKTSERYVEIIMARLNHFSDCKALAENAKIPVIDALSDMNHPCQILCDLQTIKEKFGKLNGLTLAYVGDSENNVTYSLMHGCAHVGINVRVGCPNDPEHKPKQEIVEEAKLIAAQNGSTIEVFHNAADAV